jgi:RNA polymerase-interacting CarD/CdnL/TRCF family regulator
VKGPPARHEEPQEVYPAVEGIIASAGDLAPGDRVVYPNQGVCRVTGIEKKEIAGQKLELVRMEREEDGAAVLVPKAKVPSVGLRKVASRDQMEGVFHYLAASFDDPELDWKVRHRDNADRLIAGGVLGVAEVVKGLHSLSRIRPLPAKEREQYDNARHLLVHEIAVSLAVPPALAEDYLDYALIPPEGVRFNLKPPPKPVELPLRPRRRITKPAAEEEDDLGLGDLGIDLGPELELGVGAAADGESAAAAAGDEATEGGGEAGAEAQPAHAGEDAEAGGEDEELEPARKPAPAKKPEKAAAAAKKPEKPARKAPEKPAAPAKKAAAEKASARPAAKPAAVAKPKKAPAPVAAKKPAAPAKKKPAEKASPAKKPAAAKGKKK